MKSNVSRQLRKRGINTDNEIIEKIRNARDLLGEIAQLMMDVGVGK